MKELTYDEVITLLKSNNLPTGFNQWKLSNGSGQTIAHMTAFYRQLPTGFDQWENENAYGDTVREIYELYNT